MITQMTFEEMMKRSEDGTLKNAMIKDYSLGLGTRFKIFDVLEDIELGINNMISEEKLKNVKSVTLTNLMDDNTILGIKFKNDKSKDKFTIVVECRELIKRFKVIDNRVKTLENKGFFGSLKQLLNSRKMGDKLIQIILDNEK